MLDLLIENFKDRFVDARDLKLAENFLQEENGRLLSMEHLVSDVVGPPLFAWDGRALGQGFIDLVRPYLQSPPWTSMLFLAALEDFQGDRERLLPAVLFLEYSHVLALINDDFDFHPEFLKEEPDPKPSQALSQVKYAAQYLGTYPRHILIRNRLGLDTERLLRTQRLLSKVTVTVGMSRGIFIKWSHRMFQGIVPEHYFQFAIDGLFNYVQLPVILAATLAGAPEPAATGLARAFGHLALALKIRLERRVYQGDWTGSPDPALEASLLWLTFPGFALMQRRMVLDRACAGEGRFPDLRAIHREIARRLEGPADQELIGAMRRREHESLDAWRAELDRLGLLGGTRARLERCLAEGEAPHA